MGFCSKRQLRLNHTVGRRERRARGEPQYLETFRAGADPGIILTVFVAQLVGRLGSDGFWDGDSDYGLGVRVGRPLAHAGGVLFGTELKRVGSSLFCSPTTHSTHTSDTSRSNVDPRVRVVQITHL